MADVFDFYVYDDRSIRFAIAEPIMLEDKDVTQFRFRIPKVLNNINMTTWEWWFIFVNAKKIKYTTQLTLTDDEDDPDNFSVATYTVGYGFSGYVGQVSFSIEALNVSGEDIVNEWHTRTYNTHVIDTLQGTRAVIPEPEADAGTGLTAEEKSLILELFSKAAYAEDDASTAYDRLEALWTHASYSVSWSGSNYTKSNPATTVIEGSTYTSTVTANTGYSISNVIVTMGGATVTGAWSGGQVTIPNVTGNIVITATAVLAAQSITAIYTQSGTVYDTDSLDSLKADLVVTANYSGGTSETVPASDYTLSGTLTEGTSTITVSYAGLTDTFSVTVAQGLPSGYTAYDYVKNTTVKSVNPAVFTGLDGEYGSTNYEHYLEIAYESGTNASGGVFGARQASGTNDNSITIWNWAGTGVPFFQPTVKGTAVSGGIATTAYRKNTYLLTYSGTSEKVYWNDELVIDAESGSFNLSSGIEFALFKAQTGTSKTDTAGYITNTVRIYKYRVRNRTTGGDVAYMIPCTDSNGDAGFYDLARQSFYTARGGATYLAVGND